MLIEEEIIALTKSDIEAISNLSNESQHISPRTAVSIREQYQYSAQVSLEEDIYKELLELTKRVIDQTKEIVTS